MTIDDMIRDEKLMKRKAAEKQAKWIGDQGENKYRHLKDMENN